jgi:hypothetical protein
VNRVAPSIAQKFSRKRTVEILCGELAKLRGSLIAISSSVGLFIELGVRGLRGRTISFGCARPRVARIVERKGAIASRDFAKGECQGSTLQLARSRVARGAST